MKGNFESRRDDGAKLAMPHSYVSSLIHCVFSTKERTKVLLPEVRENLWPYIGGIARDHEMKLLAIGGTNDHIHLLLSLPATMSISRALQWIKAGSSKWIHDPYPSLRGFQWQEGYGAFSVSISRMQETISYINNQEEHHKTRSFEDEFKSFVERHSIDYDERFVLG
jgi:REP element-mobilizing transposase RayT